MYTYDIMSGQRHEITMTRVFRRSLPKLGALAACLGITQPEAIELVLDKETKALGIPVPTEDRAASRKRKAV